MTGKVWKYITEKLASDGACHFSLLDPDPLSTTIENIVEQAILVEAAGSDAIMIGGSTIFGVIDEAVEKISDAVGIPTILFPGNITGVSEHADAMFFMSLLNNSLMNKNLSLTPIAFFRSLSLSSFEPEIAPGVSR